MKHTAGNIDTLCKAIEVYYPDANLELIRQAYTFADKAHSNQKRASGDPYIIHPTEVAQTLAEMRLDLASIMAALLHDTVEDTPATLDEIRKLFGEDVAQLVDGVTKLNKITFRTSEEKQAENFRKMIIAMAKDIRVILVKLADRLNNMRTLKYLPEHKQKTIAQETLDIYAPIANRLGISWIKIELEDLCLRYLHPDAYQRLTEKISKRKKEREKYIEEVSQGIIEKLEEYEIKAQVTGRAKHFYSIYKKMERRNVEFEQVYDVIAFRIVVDNITECYKALGVIHAIYKPVPGRFKDYIAMPKANSYQSLHTTVIGPNGERIEIQIRTEEMHQVAEGGIAAHWQYKEGRFNQKAKENVEWVNRLLEWQKDLSDPNEFLETVKIDLFAEDVFVFTPRGEVKQLPYNATPLDFAYAVHTDVGNRCVGAKVNGKQVPLRHRLKSGDTVEVITSPSQTPSKDWLKIVRSSRAKAKIRATIKQQERERAKELGEELLEKFLRRYDSSLKTVQKSNQLQKSAEALHCKTLDEFFILIGYGRLTEEKVIPHLVTKEQLEKATKQATEAAGKEADDSFLKKLFKVASKKSDSKNAISVANLEDVLIRFARCCSPLPGDSIVGYITRGRGVTVHSANCSRAHDTGDERRIEVAWNKSALSGVRRAVKVRVISADQPGLLALLSQTISGCGVNITSANVRVTKDKKAIAVFDVEVSSADQLNRVTQQLEAKKGVISVERAKS